MSSLHTRSFAENIHRVADLISGDPMLRADADMRYVLDALANLEPKAIERLTPQEARRQPTLGDAARRILTELGRNPDAGDGIETEDLTFAGPEGELGARIYRPAGLMAGAMAPMIHYLHGGGWVLGTLESTAATPRALARRTGAIVVATGYRLAPEHKFPAAHDDAYAGWLWVTGNARAFDGDPARVALAGEGVGANMAVSVALQARAEAQPRPIHLALVSPLASTDFKRQSCIDNLKARPLNTQMLRWFMRLALASKADSADPRIDLVSRADLGGLPPTTLILAEIDPLLSDGEALGAALREAGVTLDMTLYEGVSHDFFGLGRIINKAMFAQSQVANNLIDAFAPPPGHA